jgi:hypothetical protein
VAPVRLRLLRRIAKKILPSSAVTWYRRRRARRQYLQGLGEVLSWPAEQAGSESAGLEQVTARYGFYQVLAKDALDATDQVLQSLDRRVEGMAARHGEQLRSISEQVRALRASIEEIDRQVGDFADRHRSAGKDPS